MSACVRQNFILFSLYHAGRKWRNCATRGKKVIFFFFVIRVWDWNLPPCDNQSDNFPFHHQRKMTNSTLYLALVSCIYICIGRTFSPSLPPQAKTTHPTFTRKKFIIHLAFFFAHPLSLSVRVCSLTRAMGRRQKIYLSLARLIIKNSILIIRSIFRNEGNSRHRGKKKSQIVR